MFKSFSAGIDFRRHNLTSKVGPRTERVNISYHDNDYNHLTLFVTDNNNVLF